jgi:hypothetical protein
VDSGQNEGTILGKLEMLQLIYAPTTDEELLYMMENYTGLNYLHITGSSGGMSWLPTTISAPVMIIFMEYYI